MSAPDLHRDPGRDVNPRRLFTLDEYYAFEEENPIRHEYVRGEVFAMSPGVLLPHSRITGNVFASLWNAAGDGPCRVHQESVKVAINDVVYYPDVMAACGPEPESEEYEDAPCFVAEVLARSTRVTDVREKAPNYRRLASLQLLLVIEQSVRRVTCYWRDASGAWQMEDIIGQGEIPVPCPTAADGPFVLTLDDIYRGVSFPPRPRVREASPAWGAEELASWMIDPADVPLPDEPAELEV
ncbi:MAG TPA: Uma2 family endonuclease [Gemmatirosa sp.]